jgi:long-chain acyl-CoA synthetase
VQPGSAIEHVFVVHYADLLPAEPTLDLPAELLAGRDSVRSMPEGCEDFLAVMQSGAVPQSVSIDLDDVALMTYTSGTTGLPKGAMLTYGNALFKTRAATDCNGVTSGDVLLSIAPLYHIAGMLMGVNVPVLSGAASVLLHRFDPRAVLQAIAHCKVSWWYSIAPMNVACMQVPDIASFDLSSLQRNPVTSFGITFTEPLAAQWRSHAPNCISFEAAYGLSETHTCDTYTPAHAPRWGTQGIAVPGVTIRIVDPETQADLPTGEVGEIVLTSPGCFKGYWNKPEATAATLRGKWVHTGDMGKLDADGYLTFIGRFKEMIKVSGYSVFPEEVETILIKHPAVAQAAVIAQPDPEKGEVVKAFIVRKPGAALEADALIAWSRDNMASYKAPRTVSFIDALPTTGAGKVLRRLLKDKA